MSINVRDGIANTDPEWRRKQKEGVVRVTQDPEWRRKQKDGIRLYWENKRKLKQTET